jgi:flagellar protein FlaG
MNIPAIGGSPYPGAVSSQSGYLDSSELARNSSSGKASASGEQTGVTPNKSAADVAQLNKKPDKDGTVSATELNDAVTALQKAMAPMAQDLQFSVDKDTGETVIKVTDKTTKEIVRQIPSKEALEMAKNLDEVLHKSQGVLIQQKA